MSRSKFVIADTHFSQPSMCAFCDDQGVSLRPWGRAMPHWGEMTAEERADMMPEFEARAAEMDEAMVDKWNTIVPATGATVYHLGDVTMKEKYLSIMDRLHGKKKLILGNHDIFKASAYLKYFYDVTAYKIGDGIIMSHIPVHKASLKQSWLANVHGHLHAGRVMMTEMTAPKKRHDIPNKAWVQEPGHLISIIDPRYLCVSVEHTDYSPLPWEVMMERIHKQRLSV